MSVLTIVALSLLGAGNLAVGYVAYRFARRLLAFDELFEMLVDDIDTNVRYLASLEDKPLVSNAPEVLEVDNNMKIMKMRLEEYVLRMRESAKSERQRNRERRKNLPWVV